MNIGKRFWTMDNTDINRMFPGYDMGETTQRIADGLFEEIQGYKFGIQFASFYQQGDFLSHVKLMETGFTDHGYMTDFGLPYAFIRTPRPYDTTTLNYNWQIWETKAFSLYTNATDQIDLPSAKIAIDAVLRFANKNGITTQKIPGGSLTEIISESELIQLHSTKVIAPMRKRGTASREDNSSAKSSIRSRATLSNESPPPQTASCSSDIIAHWYSLRRFCTKLLKRDL